MNFLHGTIKSNNIARTLKKLCTCTSKGDYCIAIMSLFKMGTSLKGKILLSEGANFLSLKV